MREGSLGCGRRPEEHGRLLGAGRDRFHALLGAVVYGDDGPEQKPHPAPLRRAIAALGHSAHPEHTAFLGDTLDDVRMARAAAFGLYFVGAKFSFCPT